MQKKQYLCTQIINPFGKTLQICFVKIIKPNGIVIYVNPYISPITPNEDY